MIKITNINKSFNKGQSNEIKAVNNISLEFPKTGLVTFLGASGSGKTTLLNVISGLDSFDSGKLVINDKQLLKYNANELDFYRASSFGYVFQNYYLFPNLSVKENLEFVLDFFNLPQEEVDTRIEYALQAVGLEKLKNRKPNQLSGGQQQRVAIARALVKSPDVVIADEPTGNLDDRNSIQIMNIIKNISKECLVILVTHEERLAEFYSDRIIEIKDGSITDDRVPSEHSELMDIDNLNIYLHEYEKKSIEAKNLNINYYQNEENKNIDVDLIFEKGTLFIRLNNEDIRLKVIDKYHETKIIDSVRPVVTKETITSSDFNLPKITRNKKKFKLINFKEIGKSITSFFSKLTKRQKFIIPILILASIMVTIAFISLFKGITIHEEDFLVYNRDIVVVDEKFIEFKTLLSTDDKVIINTESIGRLENGYFSNSQLINFATGDLSESRINNSLMPLSTIKNNTLKIGRLPNKYNEVLIDYYLVKQVLESQVFKNSGIYQIDQILGLTLYYSSLDIHFEIVGIVDNNNPNFYIHDYIYYGSYVFNLTSLADLIYSDINNLSNKLITKVNPDFSEGATSSYNDMSLLKSEVIISRNYYDYLSSIGIINNNIIYNEDIKYQIVGIVEEPEINIYFNSSYLYELFIKKFEKIIINDSIMIYSDNPDNLINYLKADNKDANLLYKVSYDKQKLETINIALLIPTFVILLASFVFLYFLMRSSLFSRIYQIGIYRALGIKKSRVYEIFFTEILILTLFTAIIGVGAVSYVVYKINSSIKLIFYPIYIIPISILFVVITNTIIGLLPINLLLRKTPAEILSKYDI